MGRLTTVGPRQFEMDPYFVREALTHAGFDVTLGATITGRRETGGGAALHVSLDPSGRLKITRVFQSSPATTGIARFGPRTYRIGRDQTTTITVVADLEDVGTLPTALVEMERLIQ